MTSPGGYQVGTAFIQVLPSFRAFQKLVAAEMSQIKDVKIDVEPNIKSGALDKELAHLVRGTKPPAVNLTPKIDKTDVERELTKLGRSASRSTKITVTPTVDKKATRALAELGSGKAIELDANTSNFDAKVREIKAQHDVTVMEIDANIAKYEAKLALLEKARLHKAVDIDADITAYKAKVVKLQKERLAATVGVDADIEKARADISKLVTGLHLQRVQLDLDVKNAGERLEKLRKKAEEDTSVDLTLDIARAEAQIEHFPAKRAAVTIDVEAKIAAARAQLDRLEALKLRATVDIDADVASAMASLAELEAIRPHVGVDVDADITTARAQIALLTAKRDTMHIQVELDTARAQAQLDRLEQGVRNLGGRTDVSIEAEDASRAIALIGALTAAIGMLGAAAPAAAAAVALIPGALLGAAQGFAAVKLGFSGVTDATKAMQAVDDEAATKATGNAAARGAAASRVESANASLQRALENVDRAASQGARQVTEAREGLADAQVSAARRVEDAEGTLATAQRGAQAAQESLTRARKDAQEQLEDLALSVSGAALDEEGAMLAVERAQERLTNARAAGTSGRAMQEIDLAARQAQQALNEVRERYGDIREEATAASRAGVAGNAGVLAAQQDVRDSTADVLQAERTLTQARQDGVRDVERAHQRVADAQQQSAWAQADATRQVAEAQRSMAAAAVDASGAGSAAMSKLQLAMANLTPEGQSFATFLQDTMKPALKGVGDSVQSAMLPHMETALTRLLLLGPEVTEALTDTGHVIGTLAERGAEMVTQGPWRKDFGAIMDSNNRILMSMGESGLSTLDMFKDLTVAAGPLAERFWDNAEAAMSAAASWVANKRESGELAIMFAKMEAALQELWGIFKQVATGVWNVVSALAPLGMTILHVVGTVAELIGNFAEANPVLAQIIGWVILLTTGFLSLGRTIGGMMAAVSSSRAAYKQAGDALFGVKQNADATGKSLATATTRTTELGAATNRTTGLLGRAKGGLSDISAAYSRGADASGQWANRVTSSAAAASTAITGQLAGAAAAGQASLDKFLPATGRAERGFLALGATASASMASVSRVVGGAVSATATAAGGLVGALGGPWGLAIAAASVGLGLFAASQAKAAAKTAETKAFIDSMTAALVETNGALDDTHRKLLLTELQEKSLVDNTAHLGLAYGDLSDAILMGGDSAESFVNQLKGVGADLVEQGELTGLSAQHFDDLSESLMQNGGQASDFSGTIEELSRQFQINTGATDTATGAYREHLQEYFDLVGGFRENRDAFRQSAEASGLITEAEEDAADATSRHAEEAQKLGDLLLGQINKQLAYEASVNSLTRAHERTTEALANHGVNSLDYREALNAENQQITDVIAAAGVYAASITTATDRGVIAAEVTAAQTLAANEMASKYGSELPVALQAYMDGLGLVRTSTGEYKALVESIPREAPTVAMFDSAAAQESAIAYKSWFDEYMQFFITPTVTPPSTGGGSPFANIAPGGGALGAIVHAYAHGGVHRARAMRGGYAQMVPPRTYRVIGDRLRGDEAYIPIDSAPRSHSILSEAAGRMGYGLAPLALGGLLMAGGGMVGAGGASAGAGAMPGIPMSPEAADALAAALGALTTGALTELVAQIITTTVPALMVLEDHAGVQSVQAVTALSTQLPVLRTEFAMTAATVVATWLQMTTMSTTGAQTIKFQLGALRQAVQNVGQGFASTAEWIRGSWSLIREYAAAPIRSVLSGPYNAGLVPGWNHINTFFALNRPLAPLPIGFQRGGKIPGTGSGDKIPILAEPGEYMISKPVVKKWGLANIHAAHMAASRGGFPGLEGMLSGDEDGIFRIGYASGGPIPEALARAGIFGRMMNRKPYVWGGSSEAGTDCSGWMAMIARALADQKPYARREWATGSVSAGRPPPRFTNGIDGTFAIGVNPGSHTAGTLAGTNVESGGAHRYVAFGPPSTGADDSSFPLKFHMPELGGSFVSGGAGGGGGLDIGAFIRDSFAATYEKVAAYKAAWGQNMMAQAGAAMATQATDAAVASATGSISLAGSSGNVESWRPLVLQALRMLNLPPSWADITLKRMNQESSGNPRAINLTDVNAQRGDPSKGLMQVIGSTFRAHRDVRAPDDVYDPLANILASMRYATTRYGSLPAAYGRPGGYDKGGLLPPGYSTVYNGTSRPEVVLTDTQTSALVSLASQAAEGGEFRGNLYLDSGELLGVVQGQIDRANTDAGLALTRRIR